MYVAMQMRSIWRLVLATAATSFVAAVVVLSSASPSAGSSHAPASACGVRFAPSAQVNVAVTGRDPRRFATWRLPPSRPS